MSEADKMFKELGYGKEEENPLYICYTNLETITFNKVARTVYKDIDSGACAIKMEELKAINKKCEELGWI